LFAIMLPSSELNAPPCVVTDADIEKVVSVGYLPCRAAISWSRWDTCPEKRGGAISEPSCTEAKVGAGCGRAAQVGEVVLCGKHCPVRWACAKQFIN
jgi:hypothetical protein